MSCHAVCCRLGLFQIGIGYRVHMRSSCRVDHPRTKGQTRSHMYACGSAVRSDVPGSQAAVPIGHGGSDMCRKARRVLALGHLCLRVGRKTKCMIYSS